MTSSYHWNFFYVLKTIHSGSGCRSVYEFDALCESNMYGWKNPRNTLTFTNIKIARVMVWSSVRFKFSWLEGNHIMPMRKFCCLRMPCIHYPYFVPTFLLLKQNKRKVRIENNNKWNAKQMVNWIAIVWIGSDVQCTVYMTTATPISIQATGGVRWIWLRQYFLYEATTKIIIMKKKIIHN